VIGALGLTEDVRKHATAGFKNEGDLVILLGASGVDGRVSHLAGSEYLEVYHDLVVGRPAIDLELEGKVQSLCRRVIVEGIVSSAHDCSDGGLAVALAEACISGGMGFKGNFSIRGRWDAALFGEVQSRIVVSLPPGRLADLERLAGELVVPVAVLGIVEGERIRIGDMVDLPLSDIDQVWRNGLEEALTQESR